MFNKIAKDYQTTNNTDTLKNFIKNVIYIDNISRIK